MDNVVKYRREWKRVKKLIAMGVALGLLLSVNHTASAKPICLDPIVKKDGMVISKKCPPMVKPPIKKPPVIKPPVIKPPVVKPPVIYPPKRPPVIKPPIERPIEKPKM